MNIQPPSGGKLSWQELLSADEIRAWVNEQRKPSRLKTEYSCAGVYRFVFPESKDENGRHTPFYVGEAGNIHTRLSYHFRRKSAVVRRDNNGVPLLRTGWRLNGRILNSQGAFTLEFLQIEGSLDFCGIALSQGGFNSPYFRRLLENWALLCSIPGYNPRPLNVGLIQQARDLRSLIEGFRKRSQENQTPGSSYLDPMVEMQKLQEKSL